ncbi:hypothetical protein FRC00_003153 [Tulasnella sp. 408]|nr:hypothetical protein FRC00_003153 [Tulasnella sp. 408]
MFGLLSSRSQLKKEPSASPPARLQSSKTRSPLVRAAHKLKKIITGTRSNHDPKTPVSTTPTASARLSEPLDDEAITDVSSSRPHPTSSSPMPPSLVPSSDSSNSDNNLPIPQWKRIIKEMPLRTEWRVFMGEVGSICSSTDSALPTGSETPEELWRLDAQRRARAHRYNYLKYVGGLTSEQVTRRDLARRARARRNAYLTLEGALSAEKLEKRDMERRARGHTYFYLEFVLGLPDDLLVERDLDRRDRARYDAYRKLTGEVE